MEIFEKYNFLAQLILIYYQHNSRNIIVTSNLSSFSNNIFSYFFEAANICKSFI